MEHTTTDCMRYALAPMEGVTDSIYRSMHVFPPLDRYYTPFLTPTQDRLITARQQRELDPERNVGLDVVPQLLTNDPQLFLWTAEVLAGLGYREVNLNLGCPSGTVVKKKKGSGLLSQPERLDAMLEEIFSASPVAVSVKTRLGLRSEEEFGPLLEIYNRYPIRELIIHPRLQADQYRGGVRLEAFARALEHCRIPVCYNGNLFCPEDVSELRARFPALRAVMLGRGAVANPGLVGYLKTGSWATQSQLREFHDALYSECRAVMPGVRPTMFRMREYWSFWACMFEAPEKHLKRIRKADSFAAYEQAVRELFVECPFRPDGAYCP